MFADPVFASVIHGTDSSSKAMPARIPDECALRFRIRVRPVVRTGKGPDGAAARERDAYSVGTAAATLDARAACYAAWLSDRLAQTARVEQCELERYQRTRLLARDRSVGSSRPRVVDGPDAVLAGRLVVTAGDQFLERVVTGIGRFRAFGFGMMLLAPDGGTVP
jgi:CRISPR system Cascade subunit CasE